MSLHFFSVSRLSLVSILGLNIVHSSFPYVSMENVVRGTRFIAYPSSIVAKLAYRSEILNTLATQAGLPAAAPIHKIS